jgi:hypothetical protein
MRRALVVEEMMKLVRGDATTTKRAPTGALTMMMRRVRALVGGGVVVIMMMKLVPTTHAIETTKRALTIRAMKMKNPAPSGVAAVVMMTRHAQAATTDSRAKRRDRLKAKLRS